MAQAPPGDEDLLRVAREAGFTSDPVDEALLGIASSLDPQHTMQVIVDTAAALTEAEYASIWLRMQDSYEVVAAHGIPIDQLRQISQPAPDSMLERMMHGGVPLEVDNYPGATTNSPEGRIVVEGTGVQTVLGLPLIAEGSVRGALYVGKRDAEPFPPGTVSVMQRLVAFAQVALQNASRFSGVEAERIRLQAYIDAIPEAVIVFDRTGTIELVNRTLERQLGTTEPLVGKNHLDVLQGSDLFATSVRLRYDHEAVFQRLLSTGDPEEGLIELDDPARTFEIHFAPFRDATGEVDAIVATMRDITEPLELARERSRANLLAQLLNLSATLNSDLSIQNLVERVVEAAMELLGARTGTLGLIERDRMVFRRFHTPTGWVDFDVTLQRGEGAPGHVWATEAPYVSNDCRADPFVLQDVRNRMQFECLVYVPILNRSGAMIGALGVYDPVIPRQFGRRDVEALQLLANQVSIAMENARLNEMKDSFLSIVSHELKTPVTSIKGFTQVLQRRISPESRQVAGRFLEIINNQADRLTALINDLLDLSRIQTGRFEFDLVPLDYTDLVRDVAAEMQLIAPRNPILPSVAEHVTVQGDGNRLRQVLVNLIDNAVKYGPTDGTVQVSMQERDGEIVTSVNDQGPGLPRGEGERVFGPYYQVQREAGQATQGLGLGLFISRQIVEGHGGRIWADADDGMTFCFTLPAAA